MQEVPRCECNEADIQITCSHCGENLCILCDQNRHQTSRSKLHKRFPYSHEIRFCEIKDHELNRFVLYCETDSCLICLQCIIEKHKNHDCISFESAVKKTTSKLTENLVFENDLIRQKEENIYKIKEEIKEEKKRIEESKQRIEEIQQLLNESELNRLHYLLLISQDKRKKLFFTFVCPNNESRLGIAQRLAFPADDADGDKESLDKVVKSKHLLNLLNALILLPTILIPIVIQYLIKAPVDDACSLADKAHVFEDSEVWDAMLSQIDNDRPNKFYIIQLLEKDGGGQYWCWSRWGRFGKTAGSAIFYSGTDLSKAKKAYCGKFKAKTKNDWTNRKLFKPAPGRYTLMERDYDYG